MPSENTTPNATNTPTFGHTTKELLELFGKGTFEIEGRMPDSSNTTLLVHVRDNNASHPAIYKPVSGERPLNDFPSGLHKRETAMFLLAEFLEWDVVPPTAIADGPLGEGSVQAFVDARFEHHYFSLLEANTGLEDLKRLCALDIIANNTDRKSGHCLLAKNGRVLGIDHGLTFHHQFKLRTVMWDFAGEPVPEDLLSGVSRLADDGAPAEIEELLNSLEIDAMVTRAAALANIGEFPADDTGGYRLPWPLI